MLMLIKASNITMKLVTNKDNGKRTIFVYHNGEEVRLITQIASILSNPLVAVALFFAFVIMFPN